jgi:aminocarboxymuconate-semialdehyde decarboxylase
MANRRQFLQATGAAAAAATLTAFEARAQQPARKEIRIGGRRVKVVDVHAHCVFPEVSQRLPSAGAPRVAPPTLVLGPERFKSMDERGIDIQALSVNTYWWYSAERALARDIVAVHDEGLSAWCKQHPERFVFL